MQQNLTWETQQVVDTSDFDKNAHLASLKLDIDEPYIDKLRNLAIGLSNLKSKVDKLDTGELETTPIDLSKLTDLVKK